MGQGRAGQGRAGQGRAGQDREGWSRVGQGRVGQGRAGLGTQWERGEGPNEEHKTSNLQKDKNVTDVFMFAIVECNTLPFCLCVCGCIFLLLCVRV